MSRVIKIDWDGRSHQVMVLHEPTKEIEEVMSGGEGVFEGDEVPAGAGHGVHVCCYDEVLIPRTHEVRKVHLAWTVRSKLAAEDAERIAAGEAGAEERVVRPLVTDHLVQRPYPGLHTLLSIEEEEAASVTVVSRAFRRLSLTLHPDKGGDPEAFASVRRARDLLMDPVTRSAYLVGGVEVAITIDELTKEGRNKADRRVPRLLETLPPRIAVASVALVCAAASLLLHPLLLPLALAASSVTLLSSLLLPLALVFGLSLLLSLLLPLSALSAGLSVTALVLAYAPVNLDAALLAGVAVGALSPTMWLPFAVLSMTLALTLLPVAFADAVCHQPFLEGLGDSKALTGLVTTCVAARRANVTLPTVLVIVLSLGLYRVVAYLPMLHLSLVLGTGLLIFSFGFPRGLLPLLPFPLAYFFPFKSIIISFVIRHVTMFIVTSLARAIFVRPTSPMHTIVPTQVLALVGGTSSWWTSDSNIVNSMAFSYMLTLVLLVVLLLTGVLSVPSDETADTGAAGEAPVSGPAKRAAKRAAAARRK
jgi:hypothetical protein